MPDSDRPVIVYTAAHGFAGASGVPLGGGAAVCRGLLEAWGSGFEVRLIEPSILGPGAPTARDLIAFSETQYARFCRDFEAAATREILACDPASTVVLSNDVSEAPDFAAVARAGFRLLTIYHVDVVDYVMKIYARGWLRPETAVRLADRMERTGLAGIAPDILRLIFRKQRDSVRHSTGLVVPSPRMRDVLEACYPAEAAGKVHVLPWGALPNDPPESKIAAEVLRLREKFHLPPGERVVLALSRISPEKGQDLLLKALGRIEELGMAADLPLTVFVCGEAAYMQGQRFLAKLHTLAKRLRRIRVFFPGHATGAVKAAFFRLADLYAFPSRHESYGLTLLEAMQAGLPAVCFDHHGARAVMRPEFGEMLAMGSERDMTERLAGALMRLLHDPNRLRRQGEAARAYAAGQPFAQSAAALRQLLLESLPAVGYNRSVGPGSAV